MKILLVEDDANLREVTQRSLEKERYVVEIAADYRTALQKIEDYDYDCILLDIMLPDGSGLDLLEKLKEMHKRENVIILSAKDSIEDKVLGLELGADDYLPKPFHLVELNARIKSVIRRHQQGGELSCYSLACFGRRRRYSVSFGYIPVGPGVCKNLCRSTAMDGIALSYTGRRRRV